ncbi:hypothetical protein PIB30_007205 [Stylosanthes scabra]|uniref:Uncharacterized protein n=1 Tax=Stylosanthes scabra TaxID=79078 RepID=A0ABU6U7A0_9FABA|nr:hypothetical protein [Stylosanthes scabra]
MAVNRLTDENGKTMVPISEGDPYAWVKGEVRDLVSLFCDSDSVEELGDPLSWVREGSGVKLRFLPCEADDRFECGVLSQLKCAPSQIHPNAWAFIRGFEILMEYVGKEPLQSYKDFKEMFVKVGYVEDQFPFYLDEFGLERFSLYWYLEPVQILGMNKVSRESAEVIEFLEQNVCTKETLSLGMLFKWENEREYTLRYLETTTGGLKIFFKKRIEKDQSASNVVKVEGGVVVNQPQEKKKTYSMKRRRAEEGGSRKKVIDLTSSRCCGKDVSLEEVYAARLLCLARFEELKARDDANKKKEEGFLVQEKLELERKLQVAVEQSATKDKELLELKSDIEQLKGKLQKLEKDRTELEARVVELCGEKKSAKTSKEDHGYMMMAAGFERARKQAEFLIPEIKFDKLDPVKVVHNGALVDDDEVDLEGGDDHNPEEYNSYNLVKLYIDVKNLFGFFFGLFVWNN